MRYMQINLDKVYNLLTRHQYNQTTKIPQHIDVTEYVININAWPIIENSNSIARSLFEGSEGRLHKHKIYLDNRTGDVYLFLSIFKLDIATMLYIVYIPVYKFSMNNPNAGFRHILTLGPYKYHKRIITPDKLLPIIAKDIAIAGYNILLYSDFWADLTSGFLPIMDEENAERNNIFIYNGEFKFNFKNYYIEVVDVVYNRRIIFTSNEYNGNVISNVKQDNNVIICLNASGREIVYKPFILSKMKLVKPIPRTA